MVFVTAWGVCVVLRGSIYGECSTCYMNDKWKQGKNIIAELLCQQQAYMSSSFCQNDMFIRSCYEL